MSVKYINNKLTKHTATISVHAASANALLILSLVSVLLSSLALLCYTSTLLLRLIKYVSVMSNLPITWEV